MVLTFDPDRTLLLSKDLFFVERKKELLVIEPSAFLTPIHRRKTFMAGRVVGRLAEMIPAAISIAVQPTVGASV